MAAASTTIGVNPKTIETANGTVIVLTKSGFNGGGYLINGGANKVFVSYPDQNGVIVDPVTTDAGQVENNVGLDRVQLGGAPIRFPKNKPLCRVTSTVGASVVYWVPDE